MKKLYFQLIIAVIILNIIGVTVYAIYDVKTKESKIMYLESLVYHCKYQCGGDLLIPYQPTQKEIEYYNSLFDN